jgi:hypothetical protein
MNYLRLFENFKGIDSICKEYEIKNYTINPDGSVDVDGDVVLSYCGLTKLPLKFGKVTGYFFCYRNQLTTLEGSPREVGGGFYCDNNQLTALEGSPREVGGDFYCHRNQLTTLEGGPREVGGDFYCSNNQLTTLEGAPREVGGDFYCSDNPIWMVYKLFPNYKSFIDSLDYGYLRGTNISKSRFKEALDEFVTNIELETTLLIPMTP